MRKSSGMWNGWIATALVVLAALVLAGCPHNGLLERGGGAGGGSSRGGGGEVTLIITNFVDGGPVANRSALSGPMRTIAPEHIDLTQQTEIDKYVFVASATGNGTWGPEFIDIASGTGQATLGMGSGTWGVTLEAYDVDRLKANAGVVGATINGTDKEDIMRQDDPTEVQKVINALVLSGGATVDTSSGNQVTLTLTNDGVGSTGGVDIAVYFKSQADVQAIFAAQSKYKVYAELVNLVTQQPVPDTKVDLFATTAAGGQAVDTDPSGQGGYKYRTYDKATSQYTDHTLTTTQNTNKVLEYKPMDNQNLRQIPKGKYQLRVTVENTDNNTKLYRVDPDLFVDGNRTVLDVFEIDSILGVPPTALADFEVYWKKPLTTDQLVGYDAIFVWNENDFRTAGYTIELADITNIYKLDGTDTKITVNNNDETFTDAQTLWAILDDPQKVPDPSLYVTTLDWQTTPQAHTNIPRWEAGTLMAGGGTLTLRLNTGHVYSARIRAVNGTHSYSNWTYIGTGTTTQPAGTPTKFDVAATKGIFDLMKFSYSLLGTLEMWSLTASRVPNMEIDRGDDMQVQNETLLMVHPYTPGTPVKLDYGFSGNVVAAALGDQVLTPSNEVTIVKSWEGWQDTKTKVLFGPASGPKAGGGAWTKDDWTYSGFTDLNLEPVGSGGSSIKIKAETAGTFDVLNSETVGFGNAQPTATANKKILEGLTQFTQQTRTPGVYKNASSSRLVVVLGGTRLTPTAFELYVSTGDKANQDVASTLTNKNGDQIEIRAIEAQIFSPTSTRPIKISGGFTPAGTDVPAYTVFNAVNNNSLAGMQSGDAYTLFVQITTGQGFTMSTQLPMTILYEGQVQNATIP